MPFFIQILQPYKWIISIIAAMVHSPQDAGKCGKLKKDGTIRSPPSLSSSIFDSEYFSTNKRRHHENLRNKTSSLLCNNNLKRSSRGQQHKSIAFSDLIPDHTPFLRTESLHKVGLAPRLNRRQSDPQCNDLGPLSEQPPDQTDSFFSSTILEPAMADPRPRESSSPLLSTSITVFSHRKEDQGTEGDEFTLTPTCLYDNDDDEGEAEAYLYPSRPQSVPAKRYHRSPHWSGSVNINPFSPVPEQYLNPQPSMSSSNEPFPGNEIPGVLLPAVGVRHNSPTHQKTKTKRARLSPTKVGPSILNPRGASVMTNKVVGNTKSPVKKRKSNDGVQDANDHEMTQQTSGSNISSKRVCLSSTRSRYLDDFEEIQFLGSGSFGAVCACLSRLDGCMYAVKSISPDGYVAKRSANSFYGGKNDKTILVPPTPRRDVVPTSARRRKAQSRTSPNNDELSPQMILRGSRYWNSNALNRMLREVFALAALCNQSDFRTFHIVRYHQAWLEDDGNLYIQTELCKSTLRDEMNSDKRMDFGRQFKILREVLLALQLVHEQGCVHLDIKPENIFVKDNMFKLGDFGTATLRDEINAKTGKAMDVEEGDSRYMPRDLLEGTPEDLTKCDIFSLGITLYETCVGCPLPHCGQDWQDLRDGKLSKPLDINPTLYLIIKQMMHPDPSKRPTASDLLARSELSVNSDDVFLSSTNTISSKSTRPFPLNKRKRSFSF
ncbi:hypothetical protein ACHAXM_008428 [Skeletonema potamos]